MALRVVACFSSMVTRLLLRLMHAVAHRTAWRWDDAALQHKVFLWLGRIVPAVVIAFGIAPVPDLAHARLSNVAEAFVVFLVMMAIGRAWAAAESPYRETDSVRRHSIAVWRGSSSRCFLFRLPGTTGRSQS